MYIPPGNSPYAVDEPYSLLTGEIETFKTKYSKILLFGDFNSRTKNKPDYIELDQCIFQSLNSDELIDEYNREMNSFVNTSVRVNRHNGDQSINNFGYQLLDFLQENKFYILNGRTHGDLNGLVTSKQVSAIDYFICNSDLFEYINRL